MLENIITNPIDTPWGYKNPHYGIALRGPLSQFFSGIYLKKLDDALSNMNVFYFRFQDDILILCKTKRQMHRARRHMMGVLHEKHLRLSRKKSRMGAINNNFHFLGINYFSTQPKSNINVTHANDSTITPSNNVYYLDGYGGVTTDEQQKHVLLCIVPHARTLRKAREQVKHMVIDAVSPRRIRNYLCRWVSWWVTTTKTWNDLELLHWFCEVCFDKCTHDYAMGLLYRYITKSHSLSAYGLHASAGLAGVAASAA